MYCVVIVVVESTIMDGDTWNSFGICNIYLDTQGARYYWHYTDRMSLLIIQCIVLPTYSKYILTRFGLYPSSTHDKMQLPTAFLSILSPGTSHNTGTINSVLFHLSNSSSDSFLLPLSRRENFPPPYPPLLFFPSFPHGTQANSLLLTLALGWSPRKSDILTQRY